MRTAPLASSALLLAACSAQRYAGVDLRPGAASAELQALARKAQAGDKQAQYDLGERYERGDGVMRNPDRAMQLYRSAATDSGGTRILFVPQKNGSVSAVPINTGAATAGLAQARKKLSIHAPKNDDGQFSEHLETDH